MDKESRVCVISSTAASHPSVPAFKSMHRVTQYWSFMVVRPFSDFNKAGVEFVLTYFDNPGLSIPSSVSTWVAMTGRKKKKKREETIERNLIRVNGIVCVTLGLCTQGCPIS